MEFGYEWLARFKGSKAWLKNAKKGFGNRESKRKYTHMHSHKYEINNVTEIKLIKE